MDDWMTTGEAFVVLSLFIGTIGFLVGMALWWAGLIVAVVLFALLCLSFLS
jgi:hypothetical protein